MVFKNWPKKTFRRDTEPIDDDEEEDEEETTKLVKKDKLSKKEKDLLEIGLTPAQLDTIIDMHGHGTLLKNPEGLYFKSKKEGIVYRIDFE